MLFTALNLTTVSCSSIIFYSMPVWLALASHVLLPGEALTGTRLIGLGLAMAGVVMALAERGAGAGSLVGDVLALGAALSWAGIVLFLRLTSLKDVRLEVQLMFQLVVSAPILLLMTPVFGPLFRSLEAIHWARPGLQIVAVASLGFLVWFWLLTIHKASGGASFSFLSQFWRF